MIYLEVKVHDFNKLQETVQDMISVAKDMHASVAIIYNNEYIIVNEESVDTKIVAECVRKIWLI